MATNENTLAIIITGGLKRFITELAKHQGLSEEAAVYWLIDQGIENIGSDADIEVPGDMFIGVNVELASVALLEEVQAFSRTCLKGDHDAVEYSFSGHEGTITRQELQAGLARIEKRLQEYAE